MTTKEPLFDPPLTRRISAWWQGYDLQIQPAAPGAQITTPVMRNNPPRTSGIGAAAELEDLLFGPGATGPINRDLVLPLLGPWLINTDGRLHLISEGCDWCLELAKGTDAQVDMITDNEHHADIAQRHRERQKSPLPHLSIRACDQAFTVTSGHVSPQSTTAICVLTGQAPALADHLRKFVQSGMQRGDQLLMLQLRTGDRGQYDEILDVPGMQITDTRDVSADLAIQIRACFTKWKQAAERAASHHNTEAMHQHMLDLTTEWEETLKNLDQGNWRFLAIRARKTVMGTH